MSSAPQRQPDTPPTKGRSPAAQPLAARPAEEPLAHLHQSVREIALQGAAARLSALRADPRWIAYPAARTVLQEMERLLSSPQRQRPRNLMVIAPSNNGKTYVVNHFARLHPLINDPDAASLVAPVVTMQAPIKCDEGRLYRQILRALEAPVAASAKPTALLYQVQTLLPQIGTRLIVIDEFHSLITGTSRSQREILGAIRYLSNELRIPFVAFGTEEAHSVLRSEPQLANRFDLMKLPRWKHDEMFLRLLMSIESTLPLRHPSDLSDEVSGLPGFLLAQSEGKIGELIRFLTDATEAAIQSGSERISMALLRKLPWTLPSRREGSLVL